VNDDRGLFDRRQPLLDPIGEDRPSKGAEPPEVAARPLAAGECDEQCRLVRRVSDGERCAWPDRSWGRPAPSNRPAPVVAPPARSRSGSPSSWLRALVVPIRPRPASPRAPRQGRRHRAAWPRPRSGRDPGGRERTPCSWRRGSLRAAACSGPRRRIRERAPPAAPRLPHGHARERRSPRPSGSSGRERLEGSRSWLDFFGVVDHRGAGDEVL
jgi:hypothetical protein